MTAKPQPPCLQAALEYLARGWSALALCPPDHSGWLPPGHKEKCTGNSVGKSPIHGWKVYFEGRLPTEKELRTFFNRNPAANVGVAMGPVSGLLSLDVDGDEGEQVLRDLSAGDVPATLEFRTSQGRRLLYAWPAGLSLPNKQYDLGDGEVRVLCKGRQTAMPPSVHWTGYVYEWVKGRGPGEVEAAPCPAWLPALLAAPKPAPAAVAPPPAGPPHADAQRLLDRARKYLKAMGACHPEAGHPMDASTHLLKGANALVIGYGLDDAAAVALLAEWDVLNAVRPYPVKELERKVREARAHPHWPRGYPQVWGYLLADDGAAGRRPSAPGAADVHGDAWEGDATEKKPAEAPPALRKRTSRQPVLIGGLDLMATVFPPVRWAVENVIPEGVTLFAGRPKIGKSWWLLNVALAVASGGVALGAIKVEPGSVLYLALEDGARRLKDRIRQLLKAQGMAMPEGITFATAGNWPRVNEGGLDHLAAWLDAHADARLIIVDTLAKFRTETTGHRNAYDEDYGALGAVQNLAIGRGVAVLASTHTRKPKAGGEDADLLDETQGSTGLTGAADAVLVLRRPRQQNDGKLFITGRDVEERELRLHLDPEYHLWRIVAGNPHDPDDGLSSEERRVRGELRKLARPASPAELAPLLAKSPEATRMLLSRMARAGVLVKDGYACYALPENGRAAPCHTLSQCHTGASADELPD